MNGDNAKRDILVCFSLSMLGSALPAALFYFYVRDVLGAEANMLHFLALYLVPGIAVLPLWKRAAQRYGSAQAWLGAMVFTVVVFIGVCFLGQGDVVPFGIICILSGLTFGAEFMLPAMILKKIVATTNHINNTVSRYATLAFIGKVTAIVGCAPLLLFTDLFDLPVNQRHVALIALYGFVPCLVKTASAAQLWRWIKTNGENDEKRDTRGNTHVA